MCTICMMTQTFDTHRHAPGEPVFANVDESSDAAENTTTTYSMSVGDTFYGTISSSTDEDWVRIELDAGTTYEFAQNGISLGDPLVRLYDASGNQLASNDDGGPGLDSLLEYTATQSGTYYVSADAYSTRTGSYELSVTQANVAPPPTPEEDATLEELGTFLLEGADGRRLSYDTSQSNQITVDISGLDADGQQLARWAMDAWEMVADIDFVIQTDGPGNEMITVDDEESGAFAYFPNRFASDDNDLVELNVSQAWLNREGRSLDSYSFQTYVHEFGHALGLNHQGDYNFNGQPISYENDATFANDSWQQSVMSYFSQTENSTTDASYAFTAGAMMVDIWAIQEFYGAPDENSATAGDTTYGAGSNLGNYMDDLFDWMATGDRTDTVTGNLMAFTIYDRDGFDTFDFGFTKENARLDLRDAQFSDFGSMTGILGIAQGTVIEDAIVGTGNDTVTGNDADNTLTTNDGNDSIDAGDGNDTVYAGTGRDTVFAGIGDDSIDAGLGADEVFGGAGADRISAGDGNDTVTGGNGQDRVFLDAGDDVFIDNDQGDTFGRDFVFAGAGNDTIEGGGGNDEFAGGSGNDSINAGLGADEVFGGTGADRISAGDGDDTVTGGNGQDRVFLNAGDDVFIDNTQNDAFGRDTVFGGNGNDTIQGGSGDDAFLGGDGNDSIDAGRGADEVVGGTGADTINAGNGSDTVTGGYGRDVIDLGAGDDRYVDTAQSGFSGEDQITGGAGADTFVFGTVISQDTITDFEVGVDRLELASGLVDGRTAQATENQMFEIGDGYVVFSSGAGQTIYLEGLTSLDGIAESIDII